MVDTTELQRSWRKPDTLSTRSRILDETICGEWNIHRKNLEMHDHQRLGFVKCMKTTQRQEIFEILVSICIYAEVYAAGASM